MKKTNILSVALCLIITIAVVAGAYVRGKDKSQGDKTAEEVTADTEVVSYLGPQGTYTEEACKLFLITREPTSHTKQLTMRCRHWWMVKVPMRLSHRRIP